MDVVMGFLTVLIPIGALILGFWGGFREGRATGYAEGADKVMKYYERKK